MLSIEDAATKAILQESEAAFEQWWHEHGELWQKGAVQAASIRDNVPVPVEYCISIIARLADQPHAPMAQLREITEHLRATSPTQYYYPLDTLHITLLSCTHRSEALTDFPPDRVERVVDVVARSLAKIEPLRVQLRGLGIIRNLCFFQGLPYTREPATLRGKLVPGLRAAGIEPMILSQALPLHATMMRVINTDPQNLRLLYDTLSHMRQIDVGGLLITKWEIVLNDILLSPQHTIVLKTIDVV